MHLIALDDCLMQLFGLLQCNFPPNRMPTNVVTYTNLRPFYQNYCTGSDRLSPALFRCTGGGAYNLLLHAWQCTLMLATGVCFAETEWRPSKLVTI